MATADATETTEVGPLTMMMPAGRQANLCHQPEQIAKTAPRGGKGVNDDDGPTRDDGRHEICYTMISSFARLQQSVRPVLDDALREV